MAEDLVRCPTGDPRWLELLRRSPAATAFHDPAWADLVADCYGYQSFVAAVARGDGRFVAGAPMVEVAHRVGQPRWVCLPFADACAPLASDAGSLGALLAAVDASRGAARLEVRAPLPAPAVTVETGAVIHRLTLSADPERLLATAHRTHRQNVRLATRRGVTVRRATDVTELTDTFYRLHVLTRRRLGVPVQPRRYFRLLWERMLAPGLGFLLLAELAGEAVAGGVFLASGSTLTYKYSASDDEHRRARATYLLLWTAIEWAATNGRALVDLGRSDEVDEGLRSFKAGWGAVEEPLVYSTIGAPAADRRGRLAGLARPVLRHGPPWLTRAAGEVLYRYAA